MTPIEYLFSLEFHGIKLGLDTIARLLDAVGDPHLAYPTIHVAGTNGKGSVVAFLDAMFGAAGYSTGRFTSPHLCDVGERFLVDRVPISEAELDEDIEYFRGIAGALANPPTFFDLNTAIAFRHFARRKVDVALIEVGMGGRFDSTNVITPRVSVVTNIALDHTKYLGDTVEAIAFEKAGIFKRGVPAVIGETNPGPQRVLLARAEELACPVRLLNRDFSFRVEGPPFQQLFSYESLEASIGPIPLGLPGKYQGANAAVAVAAAQVVRHEFEGLTEGSIERGLAEASWPCRLERVLDNPPTIIDVAHNPAGIAALVESLETRCVIVLAVASDKNATAMIDLLAPLADPLILTAFTGPRALPVDQLRAAAGTHAHVTAPTLAEAIRMGLALAGPTKPLVIAGSLFTAGEARTLLVREHGARAMHF